jgi:hypothetical protein
VSRWLIALLALSPCVVSAQAPAGSPQPPTAADSLYMAGDWLAAKAAYDRFLESNPTSLGARVRAGFAAIEAGQPELAVPYFERLRTASPPGRAPVALAGLAMVAGARGDVAGAFAKLDSAVAQGYGNVATLDRHRAFAGVRADPRFAALRKKASALMLPCLEDPDARAFDFWIGEWEVFPNGSAMRAGTSVIERASGGCMILENWTTWESPWNGPYEGKSMNYYDPATKSWRQVWAGSGHDVTYFDEGVYRDGAMRFTYRSRNPQGQPTEGHFIFYHLGPNKVRQFQDQSTDGGKTYSVVYDFIYVRKGSGEPHLPRVSP